jgi:hypothetical protein
MNRSSWVSGLVFVAALSCSSGGSPSGGGTDAGSGNHAPVAVGGGRVLLAGTTGSRIPFVDDPDLRDTFTVQILSQPQRGSATADANRWVYASSGGASSSDGFSYQVTDSGGATVGGSAVVRIYTATQLTGCTTASVVDATTGAITTPLKANRCALYAEIQTRVSETGTAVTVPIFADEPSSADGYKGVVVLIGGGDLTQGLVGTPSTGVPGTTGGPNFLIRSAQLFAEAGYEAVALDKPSDQPPPGTTDTTLSSDAYRISVKQAVDILQVVRWVNTRNAPVFLAGTSRGAISAVAQNLIAAGISLSSPVTLSGSNPAYDYVGRPDVPSLLPGSVKRAAHVLWHQNDACGISPPSGSQSLANALGLANPTQSSTASGGTPVTTAGGGITPDVCGPWHYHGDVGIEPTVVGSVTSWLDAQIAALGSNHRPDAAFLTVSATVGTPAHVDLTALTRDADGDALTYGVSSPATALGGTVSAQGGSVSYAAPPGAAGKTDYFVYVADDGKGGVAAAVVTVQVGG